MKKLLLLAVLLFAGCTDKPATYIALGNPSSEVLGTNSKTILDILYCDVVRVVDGDTIEVKFYVWSDIILQKTIRFEDIDTWEMRGPNKEKGKAAKAYLEKLLASGQVILHTQRKRGKYGRLLGAVYVKGEDGSVLSVAQELQAKGHAKQ